MIELDVEIQSMEIAGAYYILTNEEWKNPVVNGHRVFFCTRAASKHDSSPLILPSHTLLFFLFLPLERDL